MQAMEVVVDEMVIGCGVAYEDGGDVLDNRNYRTEHWWLSLRHLDLLYG